MVDSIKDTKNITAEVSTEDLKVGLALWHLTPPAAESPIITTAITAQVTIHPLAPAQDTQTATSVQAIHLEVVVAEEGTHLIGDMEAKKTSTQNIEEAVIDVVEVVVVVAAAADTGARNDAHFVHVC
ncbi:uncharacterized protein [Anabrus simplex]|uniref:uncharacterized protein n=1 Tax=Anabrus simplex TaxID=316456 RepID=UPI0035A3738D